MPLWKRSTTLDALNQRSQGCMVGHVGIEFTRLGEDFLEATMPVDNRTTQPFGLLHGGASVVLAETMGSMAGYLCCEGSQTVVGVEINASHMHSARQGHVRGVCRALRTGRRSQVWQIEIFDEKENLCCVSRLTTMVIDH
ncbi:hotdog fold thioesterase [Rahnella bruchi]|uniref:hotdog fold thioesterase n=1 Tax=Rahnella bruchi TaxID=1510573 RepID=UPI000EA2D9C6|nr:hotdog fold thioesterase [Rahnella bruchi]